MKYFFKVSVFLFFLLTLLFSCKSVSSVNDIAKYNIKEILSKIEFDFNFAQLDSISTYIHNDFKHKGRDKNKEIIFWNDLAHRYTFISIEDIEVYRLDYYRAKAKFKLTFQNSTQTVVYNEPSEEFGDLSYFYYENGKWYLIGKDNFNNFR